MAGRKTATRWEKPLSEGVSRTETILGLVEARAVPPARQGAVVARVVAVAGVNRPVLEIPSSRRCDPVEARTAVEVGTEDVGREALVLLEGDDPARPVVVGLLRMPDEDARTRAAPVRLELDGQRVVLTGEREVVLRCGRSSITLTAAGKVLIQGEYVSSRAAGVHRIKGGSVQIN